MDFPASPTIGQRYTFGGKTWEYNGEAWALVAGGSTATPGGASTQVQYNDGGILGGNTNFTWDKTTNLLTLAAGELRYTNNFRFKPNAAVSSAVIVEPTHPSNTSSFTARAYDLTIGGSGAGDGHSISLSSAGAAPSSYVHVEKIGTGPNSIYKSIAIGWGPATGLVTSGTAIYAQANTNTGTLTQVVIGGNTIDGTSATLRVVGTINATGGFLANGTNISSLYAAAGHTHTLNDLTDATITSPTSGQVLSYNGSQWVNSGSTNVTNLSWNAATRTVASDTGSDAIISIVTPTDAGLAPASGGGTANFLRADGTWATPGTIGQANLQFQDEGTNLGSAGTVDTLDFTGSNLTASRVGNKVTVAFTGAIGSGITYTYGPTAPIGPNPGDEWVDSAAGILYKYIDDGDTTQWVDFSGSGAPVFTPTLPGVVPASGGGTTNFLRADGTWVAPAGTGTVTSVGLSLPSIFNVTNSPVTSTGTLTGSLASQAANTFFAAPNGAGGAPSFRALVAADVPTLNQNTTGTAGGLSATLVATSGGTGQSTYATGDLLYASATNTLSKLPVGTNTHVLTLVGGLPTWAAPTGGGGATDLTYTAATRLLESSTGTDVTLPLVTSGAAGLAPASGGGTTNYLRADGTWAAPAGGGTPGGSTTQVQYNNAGAFAGSAGMTWNDSTKALSIIGAGATNLPAGLAVDAAQGSSTSGAAYVDFKLNGSLIGNVAVNRATSGTPLEINSAVSGNVSIVAGGGNVAIGGTAATAPAVKLEVRGATTITLGKLTTAATTTTYASLNLPHGTAPTSPANGDMWSTTAGVFARINGATVGPFGVTSTGNPGGSTTQVQYNNAGAFAGSDGLVWNDSTRVLTVRTTTVNGFAGTVIDAAPAGSTSGASYLDFNILGARRGNIAISAAESGYPLELNNSDANNVTIARAGGRVGVGAVTPSTLTAGRLQVQTAAAEPCVTVANNTVGNTTHVRWANNSLATMLDIGYGNASATAPFTDRAYMRLYNKAYIVADNSGTVLSMLQHNGNFNLGSSVTDPGVKLQVQGNLNVAGNLVINGRPWAAELPVTRMIGLTTLNLQFEGADGTTTHTDSAGFGVTLTNTGSAALTTTRSKFGSTSLALNGTSQHLSITGGQSFTTLWQDDFTLEGWFWQDPGFVTGSRILVDTRASSAVSTGFAVVVQAGQLNVYSSAGWRFPFELNVSTSTWHHFALVRIGSLLLLFLNGTVASSPWLSTASFSDTQFTIGREASGAINWFGGNIDSIRLVRNRALYVSPFAAPTATFTNALPFPLNLSSPYADAVRQEAPLLFWAMDETTGTSASDLSGNGKTGTYAGSPTLNQATQLSSGGGSVQFDGVDDTLSVASLSELDAYGGWVLMEAMVTIGAANANGILFGVSVNGRLFGIGMGTTTGDTPGRNLLLLQEGNAWATVFSSLAAGTYHLAFVVNTTSAVARAFVNGQLTVGQLSVTAAANAARGATVGGVPGPSRLISGTPRMSNVSITQYPFLASTSAEALPFLSEQVREHYRASRR